MALGRSLRAKVAALAALTVALMVVAAGQADATNFSGVSGRSGCAGVNVTDNRGQWYWNQTLAADTANAVAWARANDLDPTIIDTHNEDVLTNQTDVVVYDEDYEGTTCGYTWMTTPGGAGLIGLTECHILNGANRCDQHHVFFDNDFFGPQTTGNERAVACHELGHTVGLTHRAGSCMQDPFSPGEPTGYSAHDIGHLNATNYPT